MIWFLSVLSIVLFYVIYSYILKYASIVFMYIIYVRKRNSIRIAFFSVLIEINIYIFCN